MTRLPAIVLVCALFAGALPLYLIGITKNPPGFFVDESNISFAALRLANEGRDEWGNRLPLYFRGVGDWKSPVYIYLLAGLFKLFGPSATLARVFSGVLGDLTAAAMAWLAWMLTQRRTITILTFFSVFCTAGLFEMSRLVFEVALYPLVFALFLIALLRSSRREAWDWTDVVTLTLTLSLCTYTYALGRPYGPILLAGLLFFATKPRRNALIAIGALYAVTTILPILAFNATHDGAVALRFTKLAHDTFGTRSLLQMALLFIRNYLSNIDPIGLVFIGDGLERHHVFGSGGNVLATTLVLAVLGIAVAVRRRTPWDRFLIYAIVLSVVPVALTLDRLHTLRTVAFMILLIAFSITGWTLLSKKRTALAIAVGVAQSIFFFTVFIREGTSGERIRAMQATFPPVFEAAVARHQLPIWLIGHSFYMDAFWYGAAHGLTTRDYVLCDPDCDPPAGALVIEDWQAPPGARVIARSEPFVAYIAPPNRPRRPL